MGASLDSMAFCNSVFSCNARQSLHPEKLILSSSFCTPLSHRRRCAHRGDALPKARRLILQPICPLPVNDTFIIHAATSLGRSSSGNIAREIILQRVIKVPSPIPFDNTRFVDVDIKAEDLGGRRRRISGGIEIEASLERVWKVLTSYSVIESYMPNITESRMYIRSGVVYLDQVGIISRKLSLKSRMLVRVSEDKSESSITFTRVEGRDFSEFVGQYVLDERGSNHVRLNYELFALPFPLFPVSLVERKILKEVPGMLASIREEALIGKVIPLDAN